MNRTAFHRNAPKYYVAVIIGQDLQDGQDFFQKHLTVDGRTLAIRGGEEYLRTISIKIGTSYLSTITKLFSNDLSCA